ncbi:MAG: hypothetical protein KIS82_09485, partial [Ferruginibacter sp.]|nr:hypothetical protein [Ferruginibacter sp.]
MLPRNASGPNPEISPAELPYNDLICKVNKSIPPPITIMLHPEESEKDLPEIEELFEKHSIVIDKGQEPLRIDKFLMQRMEGATRNKIQQAIENELVLVNDKPIKSNYKIRPADRIVLYDSNAPESSEIIPQEMNLDIVYEDDHIIVV